ncbi:hypothetical protein VPH35_053339 [Triticum aestivum]
MLAFPGRCCPLCCLYFYSASGVKPFDFLIRTTLLASHKSVLVCTFSSKLGNKINSSGFLANTQGEQANKGGNICKKNYFQLFRTKSIYYFGKKREQQEDRFFCSCKFVSSS